MQHIIVVSLLFIFATIIKGKTEVELKGPNVCDKLEDNNLEFGESDGDFVFPNDYKKFLTKSSAKECCAGYTKNKKGDQCIPFCTQCRHGECIAPNECRCDPGFTGPACNIHCRQGHWGRNCSKLCDCFNDATCDPITRVCNCARGFVGEKCENKCPSGLFGLHCTEICRCKNGGICHHIFGECKCNAGFTGATCEVRCMCEHGECSDITGECQCLPGWTGPVCNVSCSDGYYGQGCTHMCSCENGATCSKHDGYCQCRPGFNGTNCELVCLEGYFGQDCHKTPKPNPQERIWKDTIPYLAGVILCIISIIFVGVIIFALIFYHRRSRDPKPNTADLKHQRQIETIGKNKLTNLDSMKTSIERTSCGNVYTPFLNTRIPSKPRNIGRSNIVYYMADTSQKDAYMEMSSPAATAQNGVYIDMHMKNPKPKFVDRSYESPFIDEPVYEEIVDHKRSKETGEYDHLNYLGTENRVPKEHYDQINGTENKIQNETIVKSLGHGRLH